MWKIIISFLVLVISLPYSAFGITVSGTVLDGDDDNNAPLQFTNICVIDQQTEKCSTKGIATDADGKFIIDDVESDSQIQISYVGYTTRILPAKENMDNIVLKPDNQLNEVEITAAKLPNCTEILTLFKLNATSAQRNSETNECEPTECKCGYTLDNNTCIIDTTINQFCTVPGAQKATYKCVANGTEQEKQCVITECDTTLYKKQPQNNQCISKNGDPCDSKDLPTHAKSGQYTCNKTSCKCKVQRNDCLTGYKASDDGLTCVPAKEYDMDAQKQNADQAHENENSLANRMLGGASMAAMGIGGMELARGIAEQNADTKADADMAKYLATFKCEYGPNHADGNTTGNEVPGANQLFKLYQEYEALAAEVKSIKEALNMTPGIESQVILDKANIGLYDDVSTGKTNGTYASLYRAKMGSDVDQAKLQEMSDASKNRIVGGAVTASTGAAAGIGGGVLLNQIDWNKNNSDAKNAE